MNMSEMETKFDKIYVQRFCDVRKRSTLIARLKKHAIDNNFANSVQRAIADLVPGELDDFYPSIVVSYSTEHRVELDARNAGPGYVVVACLIRYLFQRGRPCYSDIMTPAGWRWKGTFLKRVDQAKVMIVIVSKRFFWSVHCLREVARAVKAGTKIIPVRLEELSPSGRDIESDKENMWPDKDLKQYAKRQKEPKETYRKLKKMRKAARKALVGVATIPSRGTILSDPRALNDLLYRLQALLLDWREQKPLQPRQIVDEINNQKLGKIIGFKFYAVVDPCLSEGLHAKLWQQEIESEMKSLLGYCDLINGSKPTFTVTPLEGNGRKVHLVRLNAEVMLRGTLPALEYSKELIERIALLMRQLAEQVQATDDEIALLRPVAAFQGSLVLLLEASMSFFSKLVTTFSNTGNKIVLGGDTLVTGIAPAFVVTGPFELWQENLDRTCPSHEVVLKEEQTLSLLVPKTVEAFKKLVSGGVEKWQDPDDEKWKSAPSVVTLRDAVEIVPWQRPSTSQDIVPYVPPPQTVSIQRLKVTIDDSVYPSMFTSELKLAMEYVKKATAALDNVLDALEVHHAEMA